MRHLVLFTEDSEVITWFRILTDMKFKLAQDYRWAWYWESPGIEFYNPTARTAFLLQIPIHIQYSAVDVID